MNNTEKGERTASGLLLYEPCAFCGTSGKGHWLHCHADGRIDEADVACYWCGGTGFLSAADQQRRAAGPDSKRGARMVYEQKEER